MAYFGATLAALSAGQKVALAILAEFEFVEGTNRFWLNGNGRIVVDAVEWLGLGELVSVSAIETGEGDAADKMTFTLSGVSTPLLVLAQTAESVRGRTVTVYGQFLDADPPHAHYDAKWALPAADIMDTIGFSASGPGQRSITITAESIWTVRDVAAYSLYTDRDQQARFAGDRGLEFIPTLKNKKTAWPVYT